MCCPGEPPMAQEDVEDECADEEKTQDATNAATHECAFGV